MSDLLAEVDEALRYERIEEFWKKHGRTIIAAIIIIIGTTASMSAYKAWDKSVKIQQTSEVFALLESNEFPNNISEAKLDLRSGLKAIVLLRAGEAFMAKGDTQNAITTFERAAQDSKIEDDFRHLALLQSLRLKAQAETPDNAAIISELSPIINNEQSPWQLYALLDASLIASDGMHDYAQALAYINQVLDSQKTPETLRTRASNLAHVFTLKKNAATKDQGS